MIGQLPKTLDINGISRAIRSDYRVVFVIFEAYADSEMNDNDKCRTMLECLYEDFENIPQDDYPEAVSKAVWFIDGGKQYEESKDTRKVLDWEQDEQLIFPAVNKVAGHEIRAVEYMHWWTFLGLFNEIGEGLLSTVLNIRQKKNKGKKLEKYEQEFYRENKQLIDIKIKYSAEELEEMERINQLLG
ncbi:Gp15 family bacteriophage protein [Anaerocolumna chitinilytica]|uniref:Bacteriophage Gp15 protein n=1 Tax=Anaerocolumna chitinilytica TaxID=1727145 RepID=A0A7M3SAH9_9FIRM|nr:Gp15 family bacteriophage protein [Anaerocolumna chitinilytica]BCK01597.1 hypothetical protein bsdcttw_46370 [Anaerocolumna chitinilytica]